MIAITARSLWARKRRLVATLLAVGLGVAFLAGTLLLSDTLRANFDRLFTQADSGTDVVLRGATQIGAGNATRTGVDASLLPRVRTVPGVADAQPFLDGYGQLLGRDGMVRWESVIIAVFGTLGGVILGTFTGWAVVRSSGGPSMTVFAAPPLQLVLFLVLGAVTGILAGIRPARRAARQNMITAIATA